MVMEKVYKAVDPTTGYTYGIFDLIGSAENFSKEVYGGILVIEEYEMPLCIIHELFNT